MLPIFIYILFGYFNEHNLLFGIILIQIFDTEAMGKGVRTTRIFRKGEIVTEYTGDLVTSYSEYQKREHQYSQAGIEGGHQFQFIMDEKTNWLV